jgi:hypothetical protein
MIELSKSRFAMAIVWLAATLVTIAILLEGLAFVLLSPTDQSTSSNLNTAYVWVFFAGWAVAVVALLTAEWILCLRRHWAAAGEVGVLSLATIVIAIGALYGGLDVNGSPTTAQVLAAVGIGGWFLYYAVKAARRSFVEHDDPATAHFAVLWFGAAIALAFIAVSQGLPSLDLNDAAMGVTQAVFAVVGCALLLAVIVVARATSAVKSPQTVLAAIGLALLALGSLGQAVTSVVVLRSWSSYTLNGVRIGIGVPEFVLAIGFAVLALAVARRVYEIPAHDRAEPAQAAPGVNVAPGGYMAPEAATAPGSQMASDT